MNNTSGFNLFNSAKSFLSGSMGSLISNRQTNTMNPSNLQVPLTMNYLTNDFTNSASNSSILTNTSTLTQTTTHTLNNLPPNLQATSAKPYPLTSTNRFNHLFNSNNPRILLRQESDQTELRKPRRSTHSSASYTTPYAGGALSGGILNSDNYLTQPSTITNQSRASTIKPNYLKFDKRNRLKYQLSFSSAEEDVEDEFPSSDCSMDYDDNYLVQVKRPSYRRRKMVMNYNKNNYNLKNSLYNDDCLDENDYEVSSLDEHYNLRNKRQQFRLTHGQQYLSDNLEKVRNKFLLSPTTWQPSENGHSMIGHIVLNNSLVQQMQHQRLSELGDELMYEDNENYANVLGLSVIDGTSYGIEQGAIIEKVNPGSIANLICELRKGKYFAVFSLKNNFLSFSNWLIYL